jgi:hypothetical protein
VHVSGLGCRPDGRRLRRDRPSRTTASPVDPAGDIIPKTDAFDGLPAFVPRTGGRQQRIGLRPQPPIKFSIQYITG